LGSGGVNVGLAWLSSLCTVRHNVISGRRHSKGWYSFCGAVAAGYDTLGGSILESYRTLWECDPTTSTCSIWDTWGVDGVAMHAAGCGHIIENNVISDHVYGSSNSKTCGNDDGDGIDIKSSGNRTYWRGPSGQRELVDDLPIVIRNNDITGNMGSGLVMHFGNRGIHIYNNIFSYNNADNGSAILLKADAQGGAQWMSEHLTLRNELNRRGITINQFTIKGPGLTKDIFIYRNMIYKNGYLIDEQGDEVAGGGKNAVEIREEGGSVWHGSFENIWLTNNTIANNYWYGLNVEFKNVTPDPKTGYPLDSEYYSFNNLHIINNIFASNTGALDSAVPGIQLKLLDSISKDLRNAHRGLLCELQIHNNCYYNPDGFYDIVDLQQSFLDLVSLQSYGDVFVWSETTAKGVLWYTCILFGGTFGIGSVNGDPDFFTVDYNDFHLRPGSNCTNVGSISVTIHYETGVSSGLGPDFDYQYRSDLLSSSLIPADIGADEITIPTVVKP